MSGSTGLAETIAQTFSGGHYYFSGDRNVDATLIGSKWVVTDITFSFPTNGSLYGPGYSDGEALAFEAFNSAQQNAVRYALGLISAYTGLTFTEVAETADAHAILRFGQTSATSVETAYGNFPDETDYAGDVWFGQAGEPFYTTPVLGNWGMSTIMHEIGHALGLKHGHEDLTDVDLQPYIDADGTGPRYGSQDASFDVDGQSFSLMTYALADGQFGQADPAKDQPQSFMQYDIAALQYLYGANYTTNSSDTVYSWSSTTGEAFLNGIGRGTPAGNEIFETVWDGGGVDTYDLSNYTTALNVDLRPGFFSTLSFEQRTAFSSGNVANALLHEDDIRSLIENAIGGSGNDTLKGNEGNNLLTAGLGNDSLWGFTGNDTLRGGDGSDALEPDADGGGDTYDGGAGSDGLTLKLRQEYDLRGDTLISVESLHFATVSGYATITVRMDASHFLGSGLAAIRGSVSVSGDSGHTDLLEISMGDVSELDLSGITFSSFNLLGDRIAFIGDGDGEAITGTVWNDVFSGNGGGDTLIGGAGSDVYAVDDRTIGDDTIVELVDGGDSDAISSTISRSLIGFSNIERLILAGSAEITGWGTGAADTIDGSQNSAANTLVGAGGNDTYIADLLDIIEEDEAGGDADTVNFTGSAGDAYALQANLERLVLLGKQATNGTGNAGANSITGNSGDNVLDGDGGNDTLIGGGGSDTYVLGAYAEDSVTIVEQWAVVGFDIATTTISRILQFGVEQLTLLGSSAITGTGNDYANTLDGSQNSAANVLIGMAGGDTYIVDSVDVVVEDVVFSGFDTVKFNGTQDETYLLAVNAEWLELLGHTATNGIGNASRNKMTGNDAGNVLDGGDNFDSLLGLGGADSLIGGDGDDTLDGGSGDQDTLVGGDGNDTYAIAGTDLALDLIIEASGTAAGTADLVIFIGRTDQTFTLGDNIENLTLGGSARNGEGNSGDNSIGGNVEDNLLTGAAGNDVLNGRNGNDTLDGGDGNDTLYGIFGDDLLIGGAGDDWLDGGSNTDTLIGGDGHDTYEVITLSVTIVEAAGPQGGSDVVRFRGESGQTHVLLDNIEDLILNGSLGTNGTGNEANNRLIGNTSVNVLTGLGGNDTLDAGLGGLDTLIGGDGDDTYVVYSTVQTIVEAAGDAAGTGDLVKFRGSAGETFVLGDNLERLELAGSAATGGTGNAADNLITGNAAANTLNGLGGIDTLAGGDGSDTYVVDTFTDVIVEAAGSAAGTADLVQFTGTTGQTFALDDNLERLQLIGSAATSGNGNAANNTLTGNAAANTLNGLGGTDSLIGGDGSDTYIVDTLSDVITEAAGATAGAADLVQFTGTNGQTFALAGNLERLLLLGSAATSGTGNAANNHIAGNAAANTLNGLAGSDTLVGGDGSDTYVVDTDSDVITEAVGTTAGIADLVQFTGTVGQTLTLNDNLERLQLTGSAATGGTGNGDDNHMTGNAAANTLNGLGGTDTLVGGDGSDTYIVDTFTDAIVEAAGAAAGTADLVQFAGSAGQTFALDDNLERLQLVGSAATGGTGNADDNHIAGNAAANKLDGLGGIDTLVGGDGSDTYFVDTLTDVIVEAAGVAGGAADLVQFTGTAGQSFVLSDNLERLQLMGAAATGGTGNADDNHLTGNAAANRLNGFGGTDTLIGGDGSDTYVVDTLTDVITEAAGTTAGAADLVQFTGSAGQTFALGVNLEWLQLMGTAATNGTGNADDNHIGGNAAGNTLNGLAGTDNLIGGDGSDTYVVDTLTDVIVEAAGVAAGADLVLFTGSAGQTFVLVDNLERLQLQGSSATNGTGNAVGNSLTGNVAVNTLNGLGGIDTLAGGDGSDIYIVDTLTDVIIEAAGTVAGAADLVQFIGTAGQSFALSDNLERLQLMGSAATNGTGNASSNTLTGNVAANKLNGLGGIDTLAGGDGSDIYIVDTLTDVIIESAGTVAGAADLVQFTGIAGQSFALSGNVEQLVLLGSATTGGIGNAAGNRITGNAAANTLSGFDGNDTLVGGSGNDLLRGGLGNDVLDGGGNIDTADFSDKTSKVNATLVNGGATATIGTTETDTVSGIENINGGAAGDALTGDAFANLLSGNLGNDTLTGGDGTDTLIGGAGSDSLNGGNGADSFLFKAGLSATTNVDTIVSFTHDSDLIQLDDAIFTKIGPSLDVAAFRKAAGAVAGADSSDRIIYNTTNGRLYYDADGNKTGGVTSIHFATLSNKPATLDALDFAIV